MDGGPDEPLAISVFPVTANDKEYKYSFNLSSNSSDSSSSIGIYDFAILIYFFSLCSRNQLYGS